MTQAILLHPEKSTIDRFITQNTARVVALARSVAPQLVERWAFNRFMTPRRQALGASDRALLGRARSFDVLLPRGGRVAAWSWGEGPAVLLVHGWESRAAQLGAFVAPLVENGFSAVAFDAPAHGQSPGQRASLRTFAEATRAVAA